MFRYQNTAYTAAARDVLKDSPTQHIYNIQYVDAFETQYSGAGNAKNWTEAIIS